MTNTNDMKWSDHQNWEKEWHNSNNNCANSYAEETKQYDYAHQMGLDPFLYDRYGVRGWNFGDKSVLDVGGGPYSLLLKSYARERMVLDPCVYPNWVYVRYKECGINYLIEKAEKMKFGKPFDIMLCYNVLQHTEDPQEICKRMRKYSKEIYFFDWLEIGVAPGHPQNLHAKDLNEWLGGEGKVLPAVRGFSYSGVFKGDRYVA